MQRLLIGLFIVFLNNLVVSQIAKANLTDCGDSDPSINDNGCGALTESMQARSGNSQVARFIDLGVTNGRMRLWDADIADQTKAIELGKNTTANLYPAYIDRGHAYSQEGKFNLAIADANIAIALNRSDPSAYINLSEAYRYEHVFDKAIEDATTAVGLVPTMPQAFLERSLDYTLSGQNNSAIVDANKAIALDPGYFRGYFFRGIAYLAEGKIDNDIADQTVAIKLNPKDSAAYVERAVAYTVKGSPIAAISDCGRAIAFGPPDPLQYQLCGAIYATQSLWQKDIDTQTQIIQMTQSTAQQRTLAYDRRSLAYRQTGQYNQALADEKMAMAPIIASRVAGGIPAYGLFIYQIISKNQFPLPPTFTRSHRTGTVVIQFTVDPKGFVTWAKVNKSSGDPLADQVALTNVIHEWFGPFTSDMPQNPLSFEVPLILKPNLN